MAVVLKDKKLIGIPMPEGEAHEIITNIFKTYTIDLKDGQAMFLPHNADSLKLLNNLEINTQGCDLFDTYYNLPETLDGRTLWWWQRETARFLFNHPYAFCTSTSRTGKTLSAATAADAWCSIHGGSVLVVAPLTVAAGGEWQKTYDEFFPHRKVQLVHKDRQKELEYYADAYIINPDGLKIVWRELQDMVDDGRISGIIFDESTMFGNHRSQMWKAASRISKNAKFRWGLTATPGKPEKIYAQVKLVNPANMMISMGRWMEMTCYQIGMGKFSKWEPKEDAQEVYKKAMSPCIRFDKEQLMDIPVPEVVEVVVPLSEQQEHLTKKLAEEMVLAVDDKEVTAFHTTALVNKLLQVSGGSVRTDDGDVEVDAGPKLGKLKELLGSTPRKKVVFSIFRAVNDMLVKKIREMGYTCEKIDGSVKGEERSRILRGFMENDDVHVLVCHPRTTAYGVELAAADAIICYGAPVTGSIMYSQLAERLSSASQKADKTHIYHLCAGSQDKLSFSALKKNVTRESDIVNLFTSHIKDFLK